MNKELNKPFAILITIAVLFAVILILKSQLTGFATYGISQGSPEWCVDYPAPLSCEFYDEFQCNNILGCSWGELSLDDEGYSIQADFTCSGVPEGDCRQIEQWGQDNGYAMGEKCHETPGCLWIEDVPPADFGDAPASTNHFGNMPMTAYTPFGGPPITQANYPTVHFVQMPPFGPCHYSGIGRLGTGITMEQEADIGPDPDGPNNIIPPIDFPDLDSVSIPPGIDDGLLPAILQAPPGNPSILQLPYCQMTSIPVEVTLLAGGEYFLNIWIDYNENGQWGTPFGPPDTVTCFTPGDTPEWVVQNQLVAGSGTFIVYTDSFMGYIPPEPSWVRVQLTEIMVNGEENADGSGPEECYMDGEVEDYYLLIEEQMSDLGDAPDSTNTFFPTPPPPMYAYPGVYALYPTVHISGSPPFGPCHKSYFSAAAILGTEITLEYEADNGYDDDLLNNINPPSDTSDKDSTAFSFGMDDSLKHVPINLSTNILPVNHCQPTTIPIEVSIPSGGPMGSYPWTAYLNVWFDYDRSGQWGDFVDCLGPGDTPEWAVQNYAIPVPPGGLSPVTQTINVTFTGYVPLTPEKEVWMRVQLTEIEAGEHDSSSPDFCYQVGETEDYLVNLGIPGPACGIITEDTNLTGNLTSGETCITIGGDNITLDCQGHTITGAGDGFGIEMHSKRNVIIKNCIIEGFSTGIYIDPSYNNTIINSTVRFNGVYGIYLQNSHNNSLINITAYNNSEGIRLESSSNNLLRDIVTYSNAWDGIRLDYLSNSNNLTDLTSYNNNETGIELYNSSDNALHNIISYNNTIHGILVISSANNNTLTDITAYSNIGDGIELYYSNNSRLNNITSYDNLNGIYAESSFNNILINITSYSNNWNGIYIYSSSNNNVLRNNNLANNSNGEIFISYNSTNNTFINQKISSYPTNISFIYSTDSYTGSLTISGVDTAPADPVFYKNISKYIDITASGDAPSWLFLNVSYSDSDIPANLTENNLKIEKYTYFWQVLNDSWNNGRILDNASNIVGVNITSYGSIFAPLVLGAVNCNCTNCPDCHAMLDSPHCPEVHVANNITHSGTCINNPAGFNSKTFDCKGHIITGDLTGDGIDLLNSNNIIKNCGIYNFIEGIFLSASNNNLVNLDIQNSPGDGIWLASAFNNSFTNITFNNNFDGILAQSSSNNIFVNITCNNSNFSWPAFYVYASSNNHFADMSAYNSNYGFYVYLSSNNNSFDNIIAGNNTYGFYLRSSSDNNITNSTFYNNQAHGLRLRQASNNNLIKNNVLSNNTPDIFLESSSVNNIFINNLISSYPTTISFEYEPSAFTGSLGIKGVTTPPADPPGYNNIGKYLNITNNNGPAWMSLNVSYSEADITGLQESTLKFWRYNGTWQDSGWYESLALDQANNIVKANITNFSIFAPLGIPPPPPVTPSARGGGARASICAEEWNCTPWGECMPDGKQYRSCEDLNRCEEKYTQRLVNRYEPTQKPDEIRDCEYAGTCDDGIQNGNEEGIDCGGRCEPCPAPLLPPPAPVIEAPRKLFPIWPILLLIILGTFLGTMGAYERFKRMHAHYPQLRERARLARHRKIRAEHAAIVSQEAAIQKRLEQEKREKERRFREHEIEKARKTEKREREITRRIKEHEKAREKAESAHRRKLRKEHLAVVSQESKIKERFEAEQSKKQREEAAEMRELKKHWAKERAEKERKIRAQKSLKQTLKKEKLKSIESMYKEKLRRLRAERRQIHKAARKFKK
jgi:parallel beta-helix repeat protein